MIAVDTNVLVHAHRRDSGWHVAARQAVTGLAEGSGPWAIPWPCLHEFFAIVTHRRIWAPPSPVGSALGQVEAWLESPTVALLGEGETYWPRLHDLVRAGHVDGPRIHDARVAALCLDHGVQELWTADRDFSRFPALATRNPLVG